MVEKITEDLYFGAASGVLIEVTDDREQLWDELSKPSPNDSTLSTDVTTSSSKPWANWGANNNYPFEAKKLFSRNPITVNALNFKIKAHYGKGVRLCKRIYEKKREIIEPLPFEKYPEIEDFFLENEINEGYALESVTDYEWYLNIFPQFLLNRERTKINRLVHVEACDTRMGIINSTTGLPDNFYVSGHWPHPDDKEIYVIPQFNKKEPQKNLRFMQQYCQPTPGTQYYQSGYWLGSETWVRVQNKIPQAILSFLINESSIKYHVQIPFSYFDKLVRESDFQSNEEYLAKYEEVRTATMEALDRDISGAENAGKNVFTMYGTDEDGNNFGEWKIDVIDAPFKYESYMPVYETSSAAVASSHNVPPALAGILFPGKMGAGSGAELRESFNHYVQLHTQIPQVVTLSPYRFIHRYNKWEKGIDYCYLDIDLHVPTWIDKSGTVPNVQVAKES